MKRLPQNLQLAAGSSLEQVDAEACDTLDRSAPSPVLTAPSGRSDRLQVVWRLTRSVLIADQLPEAKKQIARQNNCRYCSVVHRSALESAGVMVNLVDNACQAMMENPSPGGDRMLEVSTRLSDGGLEIEIEIADSGPGVDESIGAKVFEPLYSTRAFGVGLGLPLVRQMIEQHGTAVPLPLSDDDSGDTAHPGRVSGTFR